MDFKLWWIILLFKTKYKPYPNGTSENSDRYAEWVYDSAGLVKPVNVWEQPKGAMFFDKGNENHAFCFLRAGRSRYDVVHLLAYTGQNGHG